MSDDLDPSFWHKPVGQLTDEEYRAARKESYEWGVAHGSSASANELFELFGTSSPETVAERLNAAEAIVRDIAATPMTDAYGVCSGVLTAENLCRFCRTWFPQGAKQAGDPALHVERCPWRRARELTGDSE